MNLSFFDSVKKTKLVFEPLEHNLVKIYICGPTVYDDAHLGHARSAVAFDLLHRVLLANGYKVEIVKNFTDIDDKILKKMKETKQGLEELCEQYITSYKNDMNKLNILDMSQEPRATQNLEAMKEIVSILLKKNLAYIIDDGIYFSSSKDEKYGSLSGQNKSENLQNRIEENKQKNNPKDFVLWKFAKENEISFEADFGKGRPGWHLECSAMINKHLAYKDKKYQIDIHAGGADLLFPHHENEAAQTRCALNQDIAKYWLHNGFVNIAGEKMSKSLGNSFFLKDVLKNFSAELVRFYLLATHYRAGINFNEMDLLSAKKRLDKFYRLKKRIYSSDFANNSTSNLTKPNKVFQANILKALNDDLNISIALSLIDDLVTKANEELDKNPKNKALKQELNANFIFIADILGICYQDAFEYFQSALSKEEKKEVLKLIDLRKKAKKEKDYKRSDELRLELENLGILLMDTSSGTLWECCAGLNEGCEDECKCENECECGCKKES